MEVYPAVRGNGGGGVTRGGYLRLPPPEHSRKVRCNQDHYGSVSGGVEVSGVTGVQTVEGAERTGLGGYLDGGSGGGMGGGGGGDGWDGDGDGKLVRWEDTAADVILATEPNAHLEYAPGLELHHMTMIMIGFHVGLVPGQDITFFYMGSLLSELQSCALIFSSNFYFIFAFK